jgi:TolB-like protein
MGEEDVRRRLAAILAADVVGYSRLIEADEAGTLAALKFRRKEVLEPLIARRHGRIFKVVGDGVLVEFGSAVNAVQCAIDLQHGMVAANGDVPEARRIVLRIGVNLGDVIVEGSDLYGDGVNVAARLEGIADPGGILVSGTTFDHVTNKIDAGFEELGAQSLKNISEPVRVYRVVGMSKMAAVVPQPLPAKPSIAVLPFINMSGDPEQQYFSDGITEDIITELSRFRSLTVIARHSSFGFRDRSLGTKDTARKLGVQYVVEGSVRRMSDRVRVTARLIEAESGSQLWSEHYDRDMADIFAIQDEIVQATVATLHGQIEASGMRLAQRKRPESLTAYDYFLRGYEQILTMDPANEPSARQWLEKALTLDPNLGIAHCWMGGLDLRKWYVDLLSEDLAQSLRLSRMGARLDPNDARCQGSLGAILLYHKEFDEAAFQFQRALTLNPNDTIVMAYMAWLDTYRGRAREGLEWLDKAFRLNPYPPPWFESSKGMVLCGMRRYPDAVASLKRTVNLSIWEQMYLVACYGWLGRLDEARTEIDGFRVKRPGRSLLQYAAVEPYESGADLDHLIDGLRKAGVTRTNE